MQVTSDMHNKHATFGLSRTCSMYGDVLEVAVNVGHCQVLMYCDFQIVNLIHYCNITVDFFGLCLTRWRVASQNVTPVLADWGQRSKRSTFGTPGLARLLLLTITVTLKVTRIQHRKRPHQDTVNRMQCQECPHENSLRHLQWKITQLPQKASQRI